MDRSLLSRICGVGSALIGVTVLIGWTVHSPVLVQLYHGWTAMVINTASCLILAGIVLFLPDDNSIGRLRFRRIVGVILVLLGGGVLVENLFNVNLDIDWTALHRWLNDPNPHPGRMAPNTCAGFILIGMALLAQRQNATTFNLNMVRGFSIAAFAVGFTGIIGYWVKPEFLYSLPTISRMALHTATGITLLGLGLLFRTRSMQHAGNEVVREARDIFGAVTYSLIVVALVAGVSGFAFMLDSAERTTVENLLRMHTDRTAFFASVIEQRAMRARTIVTNPGAIAAIERLAGNSNDPQAIGVLRQVAQSYLPHGFAAVTFQQGTRVLVDAGKSMGRELFGVSLAQHDQELVWNDGFYLRTRMPIGNPRTGIVVETEQALDILTRLHTDTGYWGNSGEMVVCDLRSTPFDCFPSRFRSTPFKASHAIDGKFVPMAYAVAGVSGTVSSVDYRREQVLAAYGPIGTTGLGMVLKMDWSELYRPLRQRFQWVLLTLVVLMLMSLALVRARLRPLVKELVESRREAQASEERFTAASDSSLDGFYILECVRDGNNEIVDFRFTYLNDNGARLISHKSRWSFLNQKLCEILPLMRTHGFFDQYKRVVETGEPLASEFPIDAPGVAASWLGQQVVRLGDGIAITARDISERKNNEEKLKYLAQNDTLTGLPNRALLFDRLHQAMVRVRRHRRPIALLFMDIDHFKQINDKHGHAAGDELLRVFATRLQHCVREADTAARLAGDEFTAILEELADLNDADMVAQRILAATREPIALAGTEIVVTASIGIAFYHGDQELTPKTFLELADQALYESKRAGRNNYAIHGRTAAKKRDR